VTAQILLPLDELVAECIDALDCPSRDNHDRKLHLAFISQALSSRTASGELAAALAEAARTFEHHQRLTTMDFTHQIVKARVPVDGAEYFLGRVEGIPQWKPLAGYRTPVSETLPR
jgi:hypothetical protein